MLLGKDGALAVSRTKATTLAEMRLRVQDVLSSLSKYKTLHLEFDEEVMRIILKSLLESTARQSTQKVSFENLLNGSLAFKRHLHNLDKEVMRVIEKRLLEKTARQITQEVPFESILNGSLPYKRHLHNLTNRRSNATMGSEITCSTGVTVGEASWERSRSLLPIEGLSL